MAGTQKDRVILPSGGGFDLADVVAWSAATDPAGKPVAHLVVFLASGNHLEIAHPADVRALRTEFLRLAREIEDPTPLRMALALDHAAPTEGE